MFITAGLFASESIELNLAFFFQLFSKDARKLWDMSEKLVGLEQK